MSEAVPLVPRLKAGFVGLVVGLLVGAGGAGKVWMDGNAALTDAQAQVTAAEEATAAAKTEAETALAAKEAALGLAKARIALSRASIALEGQNFGSANDELTNARKLLKEHGGSQAAQDGLMNATAVPGADPTPVLDQIRNVAKMLDKA